MRACSVGRDRNAEKQAHLLREIRPAVWMLTTKAWVSETATELNEEQNSAVTGSGFP
jgi:hypothetical protein